MWAVPSSTGPCATTPRVTLLERTNIVDVPALGHAGAFDLAVCDVSFTSIRTILPAVLELISADGASSRSSSRSSRRRQTRWGEGGIVRDPTVHARVLEQTVRLLAQSGLAPLDVCASPIKGAKGNREFFLLGARGARDVQGLCSNARALDERIALLVSKAASL